MEAFREILENYPDNYETALKVITMLKRQEKFSEIIQFLQDMNKTMNDQGLSRLIAMYHVYADDSTYHDTISFAAQRSNSLVVLKEAYQDAVEAAKEDASKLAVLTALRYWYGLTLFHDHHSQKDHDEAVNFWEQNLPWGILGVPAGTSVIRARSLPRSWRQSIYNEPRMPDWSHPLRKSISRDWRFSQVGNWTATKTKLST